MKPFSFPKEIAGDAIRAILDNRKTVTRRVVTPQPPSETHPNLFVTPPYRPGDILYVRETWRPYSAWSGSCAGCDIEYKAGGIRRFDEIIALPTAKGEWRPSIHMHRGAARIFLRVTDVRVERLQDITEDGAFAEGAQTTATFQSARNVFRDIWNSAIRPADRALYGWDASPWVWVIEFERISREEAQT